jgi:purine nucleosidase
VIPLLIDTDTAADDCFALLVGLLDPRADLKAITIVGGNVGFEQQAHNALLTIDLARRGGEVPVYLGARDPLEREWVSAIDVHGDGVGGLRLEGDGHSVEAEHAVDALIRLAAKHKGELRVVCIGPLTNIALAVLRDSAFVANVGSLHIMGGSINGRGNITPVAEYNIFVDPEAAEIVLNAGFADVTMITWDPVTITDTVFDRARIARIEALDTPLSRFFVRANQATFDFDLEHGLAGSTHPDSLTAALTLDDSLALERGRYRVTVDTGDRRGETVFTPDRPNVTAIEKVDGERFFEYLVALLSSTGTASTPTAH